MTRSRKPRIAAAVFGCVMVAATAFAGSAQASIPPPEPAPAAKPVVNMERVLVAAQLDQYRPGNGTTAGAVKSVKRIQRSLRRRNINVAVDGNFGAATVAAYTRWQRRLGYTGLDASGMPGETSLKRLVAPRFQVKHVVRPGTRQAYSGVTLNARTIAMLQAAGHRISSSCVLDPIKGSYTGPDDSSEATHAGGGVCAIPAYNCVREIRRDMRRERIKERLTPRSKG